MVYRYHYADIDDAGKAEGNIYVGTGDSTNINNLKDIKTGEKYQPTRYGGGSSQPSKDSFKLEEQRKAIAEAERVKLAEEQKKRAEEIQNRIDKAKSQTIAGQLNEKQKDYINKLELYKSGAYDKLTRQDISSMIDNGQSYPEPVADYINKQIGIFNQEYHEQESTKTSSLQKKDYSDFFMSDNLLFTSKVQNNKENKSYKGKAVVDTINLTISKSTNFVGDVLRGGARTITEGSLNPTQSLLFGPKATREKAFGSNKAYQSYNKLYSNANYYAKGVSTQEQKNIFLETTAVGATFLNPATSIIGYSAVGYGAYESAKPIVKGDINPDTASDAILGVGVLLPFLPKAKGKATELFTRKAKTNIKESNIIPDAKSASRERGTLLLEVIGKNGKSKGIVLGKNAFDEYISIGGKIEKGENPFEATFREAKEETGLNRGDVKNIKELGRQGTPEETGYIFSGEISEPVFNKLKGKSDVAELGLFDPKRFTKVKGPTRNAPRFIVDGNIVSKAFGMGKKVRVTEAALIGRLDILKAANVFDKPIPKAFENTFKNKGYTKQEIATEYLLRKENRRPTYLQIESNKGKINVYLQSRYDISGKKQKTFFEETFKKKQYRYDKYITKLDRADFTTAQYAVFKITKDMGKKTYSKPQLLVSGTANELLLTDGNIIVDQALSKRGGAGFYFQLPETPSGQGYLGASYLLGESETSISILPQKNIPRRILYTKTALSKFGFDLGNKLKDKGYSVKQAQNIINRYAEGGQIIPTSKTIYGVEVEGAAPAGTIFSFAKGTRRVMLENQNVFVQELKMVKNKQKIKRVENLYSDYFKSKGKNKRSAKLIEKETGINPEYYNKKPTRYVSLYELGATNLSRYNMSSKERQTKGYKETKGTLQNKYNYTNKIKELNPFPYVDGYGYKYGSQRKLSRTTSLYSSEGPPNPPKKLPFFGKLPNMRITTMASKRKPQYSLQPTRYQASFTAATLNIRAKKASKYAGALAIRPILN